MFSLLALDLDQTIFGIIYIFTHFHTHGINVYTAFTSYH